MLRHSLIVILRPLRFLDYVSCMYGAHLQIPFHGLPRLGQIFGTQGSLLNEGPQLGRSYLPSSILFRSEPDLLSLSIVTNSAIVLNLSEIVDQNRP